MVDLRLLGRLLLPWTLLLASGCAFGPICAPRLEGRVTDARDGKPVADALIVANYTYQHSDPWDIRLTRTDSEGRFVVPAHFAMLWGRKTFLADTGGPEVLIAHPSYGKHYRNEHHRDEWKDLESLSFHIEAKDWRRFHEKDSVTICDDLRAEHCDEMCEVMWGRPCRDRVSR